MILNLSNIVFSLSTTNSLSTDYFYQNEAIQVFLILAISSQIFIMYTNKNIWYYKHLWKHLSIHQKFEKYKWDWRLHTLLWVLSTSNYLK